MADDSREFIDQQARDMSNAAFFAWGNLVGTIVDTMASAEIPEALIHDFLDRLCDANNEVLPENYRERYQTMLRVLRESATNMQ